MWRYSQGLASHTPSFQYEAFFDWLDSTKLVSRLRTKVDDISR